jgi:molybdate transport system substrate-binding protein
MKKMFAGLASRASRDARLGAAEVLVFTASEPDGVRQEIGKACEAKIGAPVRFSFGASSDLARQIEAGAGGRLLGGHGENGRPREAGLVRHEDRREFLSNQLVVVIERVVAARRRGEGSLSKLPHLALADPEAAPVGLYARKWLEAEGVWAEVKPRVVPTLDVRAALAAVGSGAVEAGIVYQTDAAISNKVRVAFVVTGGPKITYSLAKLASSKSSAAQAFVDFAAGKEGRAVFERRGFAVLR